jgi:hypothetical protein
MASSGSIDGEAKVVGHVQDVLRTRMDGNTSVGAADGARRYDGKGSSIFPANQPFTPCKNLGLTVRVGNQTSGLVSFFCEVSKILLQPLVLFVVG